VKDRFPTARPAARARRPAGTSGPVTREPARPPAPDRLGNRWTLALGALFGLAVGGAPLYLARLGRTPLADSLFLDSRLYWNWAAFLMQHGPIGKNAFFFGPLYPYALWPIRAAFGDSIQPVLVIQAIGGATAAVLLADAARRLTRPSIGLAIGVVAALYGMSVFFDGLVLMESLLFLLESLLLRVIVRARWPERRKGMYLAVGLLIGLIAEGRASSAVLLVAAAWLLVRGKGEPWSVALRRAAVLGLGFALVTAPVAVRNRAVSGEWIAFTYNLGYYLYVGN